MKFKIKGFVVFFSLMLLVNSLSIFCQSQEPIEKSGINFLSEQHPFGDAKQLDGVLINNEIEKTKIKLVLQILAKYIKNDGLRQRMDSTDNWKEEIGKEIIEAFKINNDENPFLKEYLSKLKFALYNYDLNAGNQANKSSFEQTPVTSEATSISAATGILSPTMVVDALGRLIAERFKEELTIRYLEKFRDKLKSTDLKKLFPSTIDFLTSSQIFNFKILMSTLKEAFQNDLNNMDSNLYGFLEKKNDDFQVKITNPQKGDPSKEELEKKKNELSSVLLLWNIFVEAKKGKHPVEIIGDLKNLKIIEGFNDRGADSIRFLVWVARSLSNKEGAGFIWEDEKCFSDFMKDKNKSDLYFGLFYAGLMNDLKDEKLKESIKEKLNNAAKIKEYMDKAIIIAKGIQDQIEELKKKGKKIKFEDYQSYLYSISEFIALGTDIIKEVVSEAADLKKIEQYLVSANALSEISRNIYDKAYGVAILNVIKLLEAAFPGDTDTRKKIVKYLSFLNTMASAKDAKEMQVAMEAFFLPVGSYRLNRANVFSFTVNAYPGGFFSSEQLTTKEKFVGKENAGNVGLAAPIGLAFTWSLKKGDYEKPGPSFSLFFSAIDIGAVFNWRLGSNEGIPEIKWKNVVAPGAFILVGLKNSPLTMGLGIQYGPQLREIKAEEGGSPEAVLISKSVRIGLIIAVDIPLIRIYQKTKLE